MGNMKRIDVFSVKGGVGKTTVASRLAAERAIRSEKPVLIIDADLTGTCLGDLLEPRVNPPWFGRMTLTNLVCERPEDLPEHLEAGRLPVYELPLGYALNGDKGPTEVSILQAPVRRPAVLFCPSHPDSAVPKEKVFPPNPGVLHALIGHESAGGWVSYVIEQVILRAYEIAGELDSVVVDHGPGIGALQWSTLASIEKSLRGSVAGTAKDPSRFCAFVVSRDLVDLAGMRKLYDRMGVDGALLLDGKKDKITKLREKAAWLFNRLPDTWKPDWKAALKADVGDDVVQLDDSPWVEHRGKPIYYEEQIASGYARSRLGLPMSKLDPSLAEAYTLVFGV
jgi:hypothetical protein